MDDAINEYGRLHRETGKRFGEAVNALLRKAGVRKEEVKAIGSHGITIRSIK